MFLTSKINQKYLRFQYFIFLIDVKENTAYNPKTNDSCSNTYFLIFLTQTLNENKMLNVSGYIIDLSLPYFTQSLIIIYLKKLI